MIYKKKLKGFTLVELILAIAIFSILLVMVAAISKPVKNVYADVKQYTGDRTVIEQSGKFVAEQIKYADTVYIFNGCKPDSSLIAAADQAKYKLVKFSNTDVDNWGTAASPKNYSGRISIQRTYNSASAVFTRALGKAFYGREHYEYSFSWGQSGGANNYKSPIFHISSFEKDNNGNKGSKYLTADISADLINCASGATYVTTSINSTLTSGAEPGVIYVLYKLPA